MTDGLKGLKEKFGLTIDETKGKLVNADGTPFNYSVYDQAKNNRKRYKSIAKFVSRYVDSLIEKRLDKVYLQQDKSGTYIYISKGYERKERLLILIHGSGDVRAGQWSRSLMINDCLDSGTQLPYIDRALKNGWGVLLMNTNDRCTPPVDGCKSSVDHTHFVWNRYVKHQYGIRRIAIVAHSAGGRMVASLVDSNEADFMDRVYAIAFTDSGAEVKPSAEPYFFEVCTNWETSDKGLGTYISGGGNSVKCVSAGTQVHEETSHWAINEVFKFICQRFQLEKPMPESSSDNGSESDASEEVVDRGQTTKEAEVGARKAMEIQAREAKAEAIKTKETGAKATERKTKEIKNTQARKEEPKVRKTKETQIRKAEFKAEPLQVRKEVKVDKENTKARQVSPLKSSAGTITCGPAQKQAKLLGRKITSGKEKGGDSFFFSVGRQVGRDTAAVRQAIAKYIGDHADDAFTDAFTGELDTFMTIKENIAISGNWCDEMERLCLYAVHYVYSKRYVMLLRRSKQPLTYPAAYNKSFTCVDDNAIVIVLGDDGTYSSADGCIQENTAIADRREQPKEVREYLAEYGRREEYVKADGNCMFESVAIQIRKRLGYSASELRAIAVDYGIKNAKEYSNFHAFESKDGDDTSSPRRQLHSFETRIKEFSKDRVWNNEMGDLMILFLVLATKLNIVILQDHSFPWCLPKEDIEVTDDTVVIVYRSKHYSGTRLLTDRDSRAENNDGEWQEDDVFTLSEFCSTGDWWSVHDNASSLSRVKAIRQAIDEAKREELRARKKIMQIVDSNANRAK